MGHRYENYAHLEGRLYVDPVRMTKLHGVDGVFFKIEVSEEIRKEVGTCMQSDVFDVEMEFLNSRLLLTLKQGDHIAVDAELSTRHTEGCRAPYYFVAHRAYSHAFRSGAAGNNTFHKT